MNEVENLRRMNTDMNRTDVENLFLKEMVEEDIDDILMEDTEFDAIIPGENDSLFNDTTSADYQDDLTEDEALDAEVDFEDDLF